MAAELYTAGAKLAVPLSRLSAQEPATLSWSISQRINLAGVHLELA
uniref:Uncharacterized protein n=1 Tax=Pseudomonas aeruginosa TaxID=287 RepID=A0A7S5YEL8_PSEAI|nr:hypothetical protein [Pseudomonas aeruginosa]